MAVIDPRTRARQAIRHVAQTRDLPDDLTMLSERWNTVARLGDSGAVAKAATLAHLARVDPVHWFNQELRVSAELHSMGAPVQVPWQNMEAANVVDGVTVTLWHFIDGVMAGSSETEMVDSLAELHRLGGSLDLDQPWFAPITTEIPATLEMLVDRGALSHAYRRTLTEHLAGILDTLVRTNLPDGFVHGDAQRKNSMRTKAGETIWIDLEEVCRGPLAWDLACLTMNPMFDQNQVIDRYALLSGTDRVNVSDLHLLHQLRELESAVWMLAIQSEREPAFGQEAQVQLHNVLRAANGD